MRAVRWASWVLAAAATFSACTEDLAQDPDALIGPLWTLRALQRVEGTAATLPAGAVFTLQFGEDGRAAVRADCNTCGGSYQADGDQISLRALACTRAFCTLSAPVDTDYVRALESAREYTVNGRILTVSGERSLLVFER